MIENIIDHRSNSHLSKNTKAVLVDAKPDKIILEENNISVHDAVKSAIELKERINLHLHDAE